MLAMIIAKNIKRLREKRGMTQETLASKVDIHRVHLARIETATRTPSVDMLEKLAKALKVKVGELVE